jgi:hypothetical protein
LLLNKIYYIAYFILLFIQYYKYNDGDWGLGIGDWGLGIGDWAQSPIPMKIIIKINNEFII